MCVCVCTHTHTHTHTHTPSESEHNKFLYFSLQQTPYSYSNKLTTHNQTVKFSKRT